MTNESLRDKIAATTHAWRDHAIDGTPLGERPICNCYDYADHLLAADVIQAAPTGDEREVLDYAIRVPIAERHLNYKPLWELIRAIQDSVIAAGFRRTEVPGPSGAIYDAFGTVVTRADTAFELGRQAGRSEPQGEPSDAQVLDADALSDLLDDMNEAGVMPELPFRDAQDIAGVAYLVDEGDTTRAVFLSDPREDRVQYDGHSEDDASYIGLFERPIDELHGPITVLRAAADVR